MICTYKKNKLVLKSSTKMENIRDIKKHLPQEDYVLISKITGYSLDYIKNCIHYRRNNRLIVHAASLIQIDYETTNEKVIGICF